MLRGRKDHTVDQKGRIALPAKFREEILRRYNADGLIVTRHLFEPCLEVWPKAEWEAFEEKVAKLPNFDRNVQTLRRIYIGSAADAEEITRPSPVHVRRLLASLREFRRDDREIRAAGLEALGQVLGPRAANPWVIQRAMLRAEGRVEVRARRRAS